ncbi:MAG: T9SS type A sorting domain-containing protein [Bacteroidales bacterium]|nr:T9SS type A sorting domain-containing protein [Bacteroidales bacterium]
MKKVLLMTMMLASCLLVKAQNYLQMFIDDIEPYHVIEFCISDYDSIVIVDTTCDYSYYEHWFVYPVHGGSYYQVLEPILTLIPDETSHVLDVNYKSCSNDWFNFEVCFIGFPSVDPWFPSYIWKHEDKTTLLVAPDNSVYYGTTYYWNYEWSTGENQREIEVVDPGIYWTRLYNDCGEAIDSVEVRNGVEISLASTDLTTNLDRISWLVDDAQSAYVAEVNVYRNGHLVGTVPYTEGSFLDNIGSEATQWQYHLVGVTADGEECPVASYWNRPIHLDHLQGPNNHVLQWTPYEAETGATIEAYRIYDWVDGELSLVAEVGYFANIYNYNPDDFHGDAVVAAVFSSGEMSYSNRVLVENYDFVGTEWYYEIQNEDGSITYQHLEYAADTTVNDKEVKIIIRTNTLYDKYIHAEVTREYVYEDDDKVYWWNKDLQEFTVLYDLGAQEGDSWVIKVGTETLTMHVDGVEQFEFEGSMHKMLQVSDEGGVFCGSIVCGIGHMTSFFPERLMQKGKNYRVVGIRCYWRDSELIYKFGDRDCDEVYQEYHNGLDESAENQFDIYPNPTNGVLVVETVCTPSLPTQRYRITNLMGQTLMSGSITAENQRIDVSNLPHGMYFISIGDMTRKFVVR